MIVDDLPTLALPFHDQGEGSAASGLSPALQDEPGGDQCQGGAERPHLDFLEPQAIPASARRKPWGVVLSNKVDSMPGSPAIDKRGSALRGIVGQKGIEVTPIPVSGGAVQLSHDRIGQGLAIDLSDRSGRTVAAGPASHELEGQK